MQETSILLVPPTITSALTIQRYGTEQQLETAIPLTETHSCSISDGCRPQSPSLDTCVLCEGTYQIHPRCRMACCRKNGCLKCLAVWFFYYGNSCPFCATNKTVNDVDIENIIFNLSSAHQTLEIMPQSIPSKKINTTPLLPQTYLSTNDRNSNTNINHSTIIVLPVQITPTTATTTTTTTTTQPQTLRQHNFICCAGSISVLILLFTIISSSITVIVLWIFNLL